MGVPEKRKLSDEAGGAGDVGGGEVAGKGSGSGSGNVRLRRELGLFSAVSLIVGVMIGSGIFVSPTSALERSGSVGLCLVVWAVCGGISLVGALGFAELGTVVPRSGAEYAYLLEAYGPLHRFWGPVPSFLCAWIYVAILRPAEVAVVILTFAEYVVQPLAPLGIAQLHPDTQNHLLKLIALLALGLITYVNVWSVKLYVRVQNIFTVAKLVACCVVVLGGLYELCIGNTRNLSTGFEGSSNSARDISLAFYSGLWAFDGWSMVTTVTEEVKKPEVNILRSIVIAVPLVTLFYFMMNVSYMTVLSIPEMIAAPAVAVAFGERLLGPMSFVIPLGVALSTFGCALGIQFSVTRLCFVAGQEGHMVSIFSFVHIRRFTPGPAVVIQGLIAAIFVIIGDIEPLIDFASFLVWVFYGMAMAALLIMRRTKPHADRPYKVPLIVPIFTIIVALFLTLVPIVTDPSPRYFFALAFILMGVAVYTLFVYKKKRPKFMDKVTRYTQLLMEAVPTDQNTD
ncbi:b(0,+)-type amino acid transporter 1-like isoform X1 [Schistocerca cancellata]|uniref:b(0,+)-type amino acid transporter 1-like isoform X1 n=1 Tax=Schistocerca cancellata TaxID=274614 RepID=UPI002119493A|nr:b(0,+)-type amino acid transporter 1-like isoform X1 [Schistocerca cancellata]